MWSPREMTTLNLEITRPQWRGKSMLVPVPSTISITSLLCGKTVGLFVAFGYVSLPTVLLGTTT